jgi:hypothetical protein
MLHVRLALCCTVPLASAMANAHAQDGQSIHRCAGLRGEIVFSGVPCSAAPEAIGGIAKPAAVAPAADSCPANDTELRERVAAAIARRDPNALAGLMRWQGVGSATARQRLRSLRELAHKPLLAIEGDAGSLRVRTGSGDDGGVRELTFGTESANGCRWLAW